MSDSLTPSGISGIPAIRRQWGGTSGREFMLAGTTSTADGGASYPSRFNAIDDNRGHNNTRHDNTVLHPTRTTATD